MVHFFGTHGNMKAQTMIFERVILFFAGVVIFVICFAVFLSYQSYFMDVGSYDQLDQIGNHIKSSIIKAAKTGADTNVRMYVDIPPRIGNDDYAIEFSQNGLNLITATGKTGSFTFYGLNETFQFDNKRIVSTVRKFLIYKNGNRIIIL